MERLSDSPARKCSAWPSPTIATFARPRQPISISQPALSSQVQAAERLLSIQVFERDRRSVLVTPAGEDVVALARNALEAVDAVGAQRRRRRTARRTAATRRRDPDRRTVLAAGAACPPSASSSPDSKLILREDQTARLLAALSAESQLDAAALRGGAGPEVTSRVSAIATEDFVVAAQRGAPILHKRGRLTERDLDLDPDRAPARGRALSARSSSGGVLARAGAIEKSMEVPRDELARRSSRWSPVASASRCCPRPPPRRWSSRAVRSRSRGSASRLPVAPLAWRGERRRRGHASTAGCLAEVMRDQAVRRRAGRGCAADYA